MKKLETHLLNLLGEAERRVLELRLCGNQDNLQTKSLALWERRKRGLKKMLIGFEHASEYYVYYTPGRLFSYPITDTGVISLGIIIMI